MHIPWKEAGHRFLYKKPHMDFYLEDSSFPTGLLPWKPHLANGTLLCSDLGPIGIFLWENWYADILLDPIVFSGLFPHTSGP